MALFVQFATQYTGGVGEGGKSREDGVVEEDEVGGEEGVVGED